MGLEPTILTLEGSYSTNWTTFAPWGGDVTSASPTYLDQSLTYGYVDEYFNALNKDTIPNLVAMTNGFDVVIEACGNSAAVSEAMMLVKNGGTIVLVGVSMAPISVPMVMPVMGEVSMKGAIGYKEEEFDDVIELLRLRKLDVVKYIDDIIPIDAANSAFERLTNMDNDAIKIIFKPNN